MRIHCKYTGIKGALTIYRDALRWRYMITDTAKRRAEIRAFWDKHGLEATGDAFKVKKRTRYTWKAAFAMQKQKRPAVAAAEPSAILPLKDQARFHKWNSLGTTRFPYLFIA